MSFSLSLFGCNDTGVRSEDAPANNSIVAYFPFEGNVNDGSTNTNQGKAYNVLHATGKIGQGLSLKGTTDSFVYFQDQPYYHIFEPTVEAWIKLESRNFSHTILAENIQGADAYAKGFIFDVEQSRLRFVVGDDSGKWKVVTGSTLLQLNTWYHVVGVYYNGSLRVYIDGELDGFIKISNIDISYNPKGETGPNPSVLYVGIRHSAMNSSPIFTQDLTYPFQGMVDEIRIYNRALTEAEIQTLYKTNRSRN